MNQKLLQAMRSGIDYRLEKIKRRLVHSMLYVALYILISSVEACRAQTQYFLLHPGTAKIDVQLRVFIQEVAEFCPEVSFASRALAIHCLTSKHLNTICLWHCHHDKSGNIHDGNPPPSHNVTGVPWQRHVNARDRHPREEPVTRASGVLHCGCHEDDVLWDFYLWKTGTLQSRTTDARESWMNSHLDPRSRGFVIGFFQQLTGLTIDDLYSKITDAKKSEIILLQRLERCVRDKIRKCEAAARWLAEEEIKRLAFEDD
jgi:hypothetical protein